MTGSMRHVRRCAMAVKLKSVGFALFCVVWMAEGAQAQNCRVSVSQPRVDYGVISREALVEPLSIALSTRRVQLNVLCEEPSVIALRFTGAANGQGFRFGRQGRFNLTLKHALMDGRAVEWTQAHLPAETASGQLLPGQVLVARGAGQRLSAQVEIDTNLPADALHVRNQAVLEGQGSFELVSPAAPRSR